MVSSDEEYLTVKKLREELRLRGESTKGRKKVLVERYRVVKRLEFGSTCKDNPENTGRNSSTMEEEAVGVNDKKEELANQSLKVQEESLLKKELELLRKEKELLMRENEILASNRSLSNIRKSQFNIMDLSQLVHVFDGVGFSVWKYQLESVQNTYKINDDEMKIMLVGKLKGRALEWFHSKPENVSLTWKELLQQLELMFDFKESKMELKKKFEARRWRVHESFMNYCHEKLILGSQLQLNEDELVECVIEGIPSVSLRDSARIQQYNSTQKLIQAFKNIKLQDYFSLASSKKQVPVKASGSHPVPDRSVPVRCYNCGKEGHTATKCESPRIPRGACYSCGSTQHQQRDCPKKYQDAKKDRKDEVINMCEEIRVSDSFIELSILKEEHNIFRWKTFKGLIDTGSAVSLIRAGVVNGKDIYPIDSNRKFYGINNIVMDTKGMIDLFVQINDTILKIPFIVVSDDVISIDILVGRNLFKESGLSLVIDNLGKNEELEILNM